MAVGFIGLGIMGSRMAARLLSSGCDLVVHNRTREKAEPLVAQGARWADTPAQVGRQVDILFTMLSEPRTVRQAASGAEGFLAQLKPGSLWVDCSTGKPAFPREMAGMAQGLGIRYVEAPVMGSKDAAGSGQLRFFVGGEAADVEACRPYFSAMGEEVKHLGGHGMGTTLKLVFNYMVAQVVLSFSEALVLGESLGLPKGTLLDAVLSSFVAAPYLATKRGNFETGSYPAAFPLRWMRKDLEMVSETAYEQGVVLPAGNLAKEIYGLAARAGLAGQDFTAVHKFLSESQDGKE